MENFSCQHLQTLLAVFRLGSMAAAAELLHISPSQVSRLVAQAELSIGVRLLERNGPRLSLSKAARVLLPELERLLSDMMDVSRIGQSLRAGDTGHLSIGYTMLTGVTFLAPFIQMLAAAHPNLSLTLSNAPDTDLEEKLLTARLDTALLNLPLKTPSLRYHSLHFDPLCLAVPSEWQASLGIAIDDPRIESLLVAPFHHWPGTLTKVKARARALGQSPNMVESVNEANGRMALALGRGSAALVSQVRARGCPDGISVVPIKGYEDIGFETVLAVAPCAPPLAIWVLEHLTKQ